MGFWWPCESCIILRDIRKGIASMMSVRGSRPRIRAKRLVALVRYAILRDRWHTACRYAFAYQFLLRVPSELLRQVRPVLLRIDPATRAVALGPLQRKTVRSELLHVPCICSSKEGALVCAHVWAQWLQEKYSNVAEHSSCVLYVDYQAFLKELRKDLEGIGLSKEEAQVVGSHAFRHGAAKDLLQETSLRNTMIRGGWKSAGVFHYTPKAEVEAQAMAEVWEGLSEDEC